MKFTIWVHRAMSKISFENPEYTGDADGLGVLRILEADSRERINKPRVYQAVVSEMFGKVLETPQKETTPFYPRPRMRAQRCTHTGWR